ncbi:MAG: hypothetical protein HYZ68_02710 [Chloroflexi bacterium]|nr:hypothetical protein [Chloroflexota bacterium]
MAVPEELLFLFPSPPSPEAPEWDGSPIGVRNVITRTKGRTAVQDKRVDRQPGLRDRLVRRALQHRQQSPIPHFEHDVVIHGIRVRAATNSPHLYDFWVDNWYSPEEWTNITGLPAPADPHIHVYAYGGVTQEQEAAYYSRATNSIVFFNTSYYGQLKSWVLGAVGRVLAEEYGVHSVHGACVEKDGKGVLYIAPTGTGKSTSSYGLMDFPGSRFHSDDWVYIRYAFPHRSGEWVAPVTITTPQGEAIHGYRVFRWLKENGNRQGEARGVGLTLGNQRIEFAVKELDLSNPPQAYAYISEKVFYLRSNIVENYPLAVYELIHSKFENAPDVTPHFYQEKGPLIDEICSELIGARDPQVRAYFGARSRESLREIAARLIAFDNARAMLNITNVFGKAKAFTNPMEPVRLASVFLLKRNGDENAVLEWLGEAEFITRLMIGETPAKNMETAYNAYRAVDDEEERGFIDRLLKESQFLGVHPYDLYPQRADTPATHYEEFELFRTLQHAADCYHMNTILRKDPRVRETREAVRLTMGIIARTVAEQPEGVYLTLDNYHEYAKAGTMEAVKR